MRKWAVSLAVMGLGGIGALLLSDKGRRSLRWALDRMSEAPDRLAEWNENTQRELERIQKALDQLSATMAQVRPIR